MTTEEKNKLIEEAKIRYPIGTIFKSVTSNKIFTIKSHDASNSTNNIVFETLELNNAKRNYGAVYSTWQQKWAEIVSKPEDNSSKDKPFYVVVTEENKEVLSKWGSGAKVGKLVGLYLWTKSGRLEKGINPVHIIKENSYTFGNEISFEQFLELYPEYKEDKITTIPEYVECIKIDTYLEIGKIYKVDKSKGFKYRNEKSLVYYFIDVNQGAPYYQSSFKPSTKEAYDMQNKPKSLVGRYVKRLNYDITSCNVGDYLIILNDHIDYLIIEKYGRLEKYDLNHWELMPEGFEPIKSDDFVLPEKWCIKFTKYKDWKEFAKFKPFDKKFCGTSLNYYYSSNGLNVFCDNGIKSGYTEITFEQFKKYVLKEDVMSIINHECRVNIDKNRSFNTFEQVSHLLTEMVKLYKETSFTQQSLKTELELIPIKKLKTFNN